MFQLTLPEWGANDRKAATYTTLKFQLTLPEWGATDILEAVKPLLAVSTHAPRVGSDQATIPMHRTNRRFNSRSPSGERLGEDIIKAWEETFQLTLPEWGATSTHKNHSFDKSFNSRSPNGERRLRWLPSSSPQVSTHAPRVGSDWRNRRNRC